MKVFNNVFFVLFSAMLISSCCHKSATPKKVNYIPPSTEDYFWFQFPEGPRIFKNQFGEFDTMISNIPDKEFNSEFKPTGEKVFNSCEEFTYYGYLAAEFRHPGSNFSLINISTASHELYNTEKIFLSVVLSSSYGAVGKFIPMNDTTMTVNGINYSDVSVIDSIQRENVTSQYFKHLYYSKSTGPVKYITPNDDVFELVN